MHYRLPTCPDRHRVAVACASVRRRAREVRPAVPPRSEHSIVRLDSVDGAVLHVQTHNTNTTTILQFVQHESKVIVGSVRVRDIAIQLHPAKPS